MKLTLDFKERLVFNGILPDSGNIIDMTIRKDLLEKVILTQGELVKSEIKETEEGGYKWDDKKVESFNKTIDLTKAEMTYLKKCVKQLDDEGKVNQDLLPLCIKVNDLKEEEK